MSPSAFLIHSITFDKVGGKDRQLLAEKRGQGLADQIPDGLLSAAVSINADIKLAYH
jgi:hypothetical protein